jgi:hypothetical protein
MTGCESRAPTCRYCGVEIMFVGTLWLKRRTADVNGFCPNSPDDDLRHPVADAETQRPESRR